MSTYEMLSIVISIISLVISGYATISVQKIKTSIIVNGDRNLTAGGDIDA